MNERAIEILTPLLGADRAHDICALVSLAEALAAIGQQNRDLQQRINELEQQQPEPEGGEAL